MLCESHIVPIQIPCLVLLIQILQTPQLFKYSTNIEKYIITAGQRWTIPLVCRLQPWRDSCVL